MSVEAERKRERPKPFAEDWRAPGTPRPPTTVANPLGAAGRVEPASLRPSSVGARFRRYSVEELAGAPSVDPTGIDLSPDGAEVAFSWDRSGAHEIYTAPLVGDRIIQLTEAGSRSVAPRWSPDGRWVAFLRDGGGGKTGIWLVDRDGEHERRISLDEAVVYREHAWSPDGSRIAYAADAHGGAFALYVMDVATGKHRGLTDGRQDDRRPRWSPDGKWVLFWSGNASSADLYIVPAEGGEPRTLVTRDGLGGSFEGRWSPDGTAIAFTTTARGRSEIAFAHLRDGEVARLERVGATPFEDDGPVWRPDGRGVVYRHTVGADVSVRRVFTVSRADEAVADLPGVHDDPQVAPDSETVLAVFSEARRPADVVVRPRGATETRRITRSLPDGIDPGTLVEPVLVSYPGADGTEIPALLYVPHEEALDGAGPPPAIVLVRDGAHLRAWDPLAQLLANGGHVVLAPKVATGDETDAPRGAEWLEREGIGRGRSVVAAAGRALATREERIHAARRALERTEPHRSGR